MHSLNFLTNRSNDTFKPAELLTDVAYGISACDRLLISVINGFNHMLPIVSDLND